jgi:hypothetical protein
MNTQENNAPSATTPIELTVQEQLVLIKQEIQRFTAIAKEKGVLSIEEINELLPPEIVAAEVLDQFMQALEVAGVEFTESSENSKDDDSSDTFYLADPNATEEEEEEKKKLPKTPRATTQFACTCEKWGVCLFSLERARSKLPAGSKMESVGSLRRS